MIKIYLYSCLIYFLATSLPGIIFNKRFKKCQKIFCRYISSDDKKWGYIKTTMYYVFISMIPFVRLICFISKIWFLINPQSFSKYVENFQKIK